MTIEQILRHFKSTLCAIISSWVCIQKPYSDVVILICYSIYYSGQDAPQVFVHIKRIKLAKKNVKKMSTFSYEKTYLPSLCSNIVYNKRIGKLFTVLEKISTLGLIFFPSKRGGSRRADAYHQVSGLASGWARLIILILHSTRTDDPMHLGTIKNRVEF